ncbi:MAG: hypothetical protein LWW85_06670 [Marinilabiliales bacterium]|nr:hypothetical protein [Marinilabiliales bacterium]
MAKAKKFLILHGSRVKKQLYLEEFPMVFTNKSNICFLNFFWQTIRRCYPIRSSSFIPRHHDSLWDAIWKGFMWIDEEPESEELKAELLEQAEEFMELELEYEDELDRLEEEGENP